MSKMENSILYLTDKIIENLSMPIKKKKKTLNTSVKIYRGAHE